METIRALIFTEPTKKAKQDLIAALKEQLTSQQLAFSEFFSTIQTYESDKAYPENRIKASELLSTILAKLPPAYLLQIKEFSRELVEHYIERIESKDNAMVFNTQGFLVLMRRLVKQVDEPTFLLFLSLIDDINIQSFTQEIRMNLLKAIDLVIESVASSDYLNNHRAKVFSILLTQFEGEKDPRNIIVVLDIWTNAIREEETSGLEEQIFDLVAEYYPVTFKMSQKTYLFDKTLINEKLIICLTKKIFMERFLKLSFEKLLDEETLADKVEVLNSLKTLFNMLKADEARYSAFCDHIDMVVQKLLFVVEEIKEIENSEFEKVLEGLVELLDSRNDQIQGFTDARVIAAKASLLKNFNESISKNVMSKSSKIFLHVLAHSLKRLGLDDIGNLLAVLGKNINKKIVEQSYEDLNNVATSMTPIMYSYYTHVDRILVAKEDFELNSFLTNFLEFLKKDITNLKRKAAVRLYSFYCRVFSIPKDNIPYFNQIQNVDFEDGLLINLSLFYRNDKQQFDVTLVNCLQQKLHAVDISKTILFNNFECDISTLFKLYVDNIRDLIKEGHHHSETFSNVHSRLISAFKLKFDRQKANTELYPEVTVSIFEILTLLISYGRHRNEELAQSLLELEPYTHLCRNLDTITSEQNNTYYYIRASDRDTVKGHSIDDVDLNNHSEYYYIYTAKLATNISISLNQSVVDKISEAGINKHTWILIRAFLYRNFEEYKILSEKTFLDLLSGQHMDLLDEFITELLSADARLIKPPLYDQKILQHITSLIRDNRSHFSDLDFYQQEMKLIGINLSNNEFSCDTAKALRLIIDYAESHPPIASDSSLSKFHNKLLIALNTIIEFKSDATTKTEELNLSYCSLFKDHSPDFKLLISFLVYLEKYISKTAFISPSIKYKYEACLKRLLHHSKRLVRKYAGFCINALNCKSR